MNTKRKTTTAAQRQKVRFSVRPLFAVYDSETKQIHEVYTGLDIALSEVEYLKREARKAKTPAQRKALAQYIDAPLDEDLKRWALINERE